LLSPSDDGKKSAKGGGQTADLPIADLTVQCQGRALFVNIEDFKPL
jgi:hypothetical protein